MNKKPLINTMQPVNKRKVALYFGDGSDAGRLAQSLLAEVDANCEILVAGPENLRELLRLCCCLIMPGGADLPYCKALNGSGNLLIRNFVEMGGVYLGICAGAYYAAKRIEFHKGRLGEICGIRELEFFAGTAVGSLGRLGAFYDGTISTAHAATIAVGADDEFSAYYHGGCALIPDPDTKDIEVLACYADLPDRPAACVKIPVGKGLVILCGVHAELGPKYLDDAGADERYLSVLDKLRLTDEKRRVFWRDLLKMCGLPLR